MGEEESQQAVKVEIQPSKKDFEDPILQALKSSIKSDVDNSELTDMVNQVVKQVNIIETFAVTFKDDPGAVDECKKIIRVYFKKLEPVCLEMFIEIFQSCYDSKSLASLDSTRKESKYFKTSKGNKAAMRMNYRIGVEKNRPQHKANEFTMVIGLKFEYHTVDEKHQILEGDMFD